MASADNFNYECNLCGKTFTTNYNLKRHIKTVHHSIPHIESKRISAYKCGLCDGRFETLNNFNDHIVSGHNIKINNSTLHFDNQDEFLKWKKTVEEEETASYVQRRAAYSTKEYLVTNYCCNRSGNYRTAISSPSKRKRHLKIQGSNKINSYCPAKIKAYFDKDGSVKVIYCSTHVGHKLELCHLELSRDERKELASKIAKKIPFEAIIQEVKTNVTDVVKRKHLLTKADLRNIVRTYSVDRESIRDADDATNLEGSSHDQMQSNTDSVILDKQNGANSDKFPECRKPQLLNTALSSNSIDKQNGANSDKFLECRKPQPLNTALSSNSIDKQNGANSDKFLECRKPQPLNTALSSNSIDKQNGANSDKFPECRKPQPLNTALSSNSMKWEQDMLARFRAALSRCSNTVDLQDYMEGVMNSVESKLSDLEETQGFLG
ncbi:uncharacterized protein [Halyomorpha halys]|uniref:uncharacterized protein n=1 Tax=Halyomorpha halys TaxID=286706 RepID=UPI0006D4E1B8|nr:uncharacterized protein LOC106684007 [Halyomorpha halys]XP_014281308.1 uncharacterized protein LOC106684007 [Halyomorpha halys]